MDELFTTSAINLLFPVIQSLFYAFLMARHASVEIQNNHNKPHITSFIKGSKHVFYFVGAHNAQFKMAVYK